MIRITKLVTIMVVCNRGECTREAEFTGYSHNKALQAAKDAGWRFDLSDLEALFGEGTIHIQNAVYCSKHREDILL